MKSIAPKLTSFILFLASFNVFGQYYDGGIGLTGFYGEEFDYGYAGNLSYSHKINYFDYIEVGVQVSSIDLEFLGRDIPTDIYSFNAGFYYDLFRNNRRFFHNPAFAIVLGGGLQIGWERFDLSEIRLEDGTEIDVETEKLVFGPYVGANVDFFVNQFFAIAIKLTETYHVNSDIGNFVPYAGIGLKFVMNY